MQLPKRKKRRQSLTFRQERLAVEYVKSRNYEQAYLAAGYTPMPDPKDNNRKGWQFCHNPRVKERIRQLMDKAEKLTVLSVVAVLNNYQKIYQAAMDDGDYAAANKAMELYGKHLGLFQERVEINSKITHLDGGKSSEDIDRDIQRLADLTGLRITAPGTDTKQ